MASNRIARINDAIQKELSALLRTVKDPRVAEGMLTITHVDTTSDLRYARVYISALNCPDEKALLKGLRLAAPCAGQPCGPALHAGAPVFYRRFHRLWRSHSGYAEPCEACRSPERGHRPARGPGGLRRAVL